MKLTLALFTAALVASSSTAAPAPTRKVYTLSDAFLSEDMEEPSPFVPTSEDELPPAFPLEDAPVVYGEAAEDSSAGSSFSPVSALLGKLGFGADHPANLVFSYGATTSTDNEDADSSVYDAEPSFNMDSMTATETSTQASSVYEEWKSHIEEMLRESSENMRDAVVVVDEEIAVQAQAAEGDELNDVKWWRVASGGKWEVKDGSGRWRQPVNGEMPPMGKPVPKPTILQAQEAEEENRLELPHHHSHPAHAHSAHHHAHHQHAQGDAHAHAHSHSHRVSCTFSARLHRVVRNLQPIEAAAFALVFGAGIGALGHTIFMFLLLSFRRLRNNTPVSKAGPIRLGGDVVVSEKA